MAKLPQVFLALFVFLTLAKCEHLHVYTNHFVAEIEGGKPEAQRLAGQYNLRLMPTLLIGPDIYHYVDRTHPPFDRKPALRLTRSLNGHRRVKYADQQILRYRTLRSYDQLIPKVIENRFWASNKELNFNDPYYSQLWHLHGRGLYNGTNKKTVNLNVEPVWKQGITGHGITLFVLDDGVQARNKEIAPNYESKNSWDVSDIHHFLHSQRPRGPEDTHGTFCAASMVAAANNSVCGLGVAYNAKVGGIRVLGQNKLTDMQESMALSLWLHNADVVSASWGPRDNGKTVEGPKRLARKALKKAVTEGRKGKGAILVWAAGNGGMFSDNANLDGYASSIYTITVGALSHTGLACIYSEEGASVLASVAVSGFAMGAYGISIVVPRLDGTCKTNFQGTSASAPLAAGVIALLLEANPELGWRDVQHLIAITAQKTGFREQWRRNGAGLEFNLKHGFGAINAEILVAAGKHWKNLPPQKREIRPFPAVINEFELLSMQNTSTQLKIRDSNIKRLEHVIVVLTIQHHYRGALEIFITSPSGTESQVLTKRGEDKSSEGFHDWPFMSVHFWGEKPIGTWKLTVNNSGEKKGTVQKARLVLYGH